MSTYKALVGKKIKSVSSDPSDSVDGQMWYNTTTQSLRGLAITEAWASGSPLLSINYGAGGAGSQTAMLYFGGANYTGSPPYSGSITNATYEYNGTGWSTSGNYTGSVVYVSGCGTQTAGLGAGGFTFTETLTASAEYDGSTWTAGNSMSQKRNNAGTNMVGTQPAALITGGDQYPSTPRSLSTCEEYDGTNWTSGGGYPVVIQNTAQAGTQTAGWAAGGVSDITPGSSNVSRDATNHYDGSSWSAGGTLPAVNYRAGAAGTQTAGLTFGGFPNTTNTFAYDGTTWTAKPALALARNNIGSGGVSSTTTAAIGAGGYDPGPGSTSATEEFTSSTNVITAAAWASGGSLNTTRTSMFTGPIGTQTAGYAAGGSTPGPRSNATEEYDGSSWTTVNTVPVSLSSRGGAGTQTAAVLFSGNPNPSTVTTTTEYDGTNYSEGGAMNNSRGYGPIASGTQTAALGGGGYNPSASPGNITVTEYYNGTAWTSQPAANPATYGGASGGTQSATWMVAGIQQPPSPTKAVVEWDGSSWTAGASYGTDFTVNLFGGGPQTAAWICGGQIYPGSELRASTNHYNGTVWATAPSLGTARSGACQGGTQAAGLVAGGINSLPSTRTNATEEFTGETTAANVETFSTS